jgi:hypothetical protein
MTTTNSHSGIDPRAFSPEKLEAPHPLPAVGRKALKRVKDRLPKPVTCRYCDSRVFIAHHKEVYGGLSFGSWPYVYLCESCGAYVGLHDGTDLPLGTLADAQLRESRKVNKRAFQSLLSIMAMDGVKRTQVYEWLAEKMEIPASECHWGWFEFEQCEMAGKMCRQKINELSGVLLR